MNFAGKRSVVTTAIVCALVIALLGCNAQMPQLGEDGLYILPETTVIYNDADSAGHIEMGLPDGFFGSLVSEEGVIDLVPDSRYPCVGSACWDGEGKLLTVYIRVEVDGSVISVDFPIERHYTGFVVRCDDPAVTRCNGVEFSVVKHQSDNLSSVYLQASAKFGSQYVHINHSFDKENAECEQEAFEKVVRWMSLCKGKDLRQLLLKHFDSVGYYNMSISRPEAYGDNTFGHLLPTQFTYNLQYFSSKSFRRYKDYDDAYLAGEWTYARIYLRWEISMYTAADEQYLWTGDPLDELALNNDAVIYNYEDVTKELLSARETVGIDVKQILINVKYGEYVIRIRSRNIVVEDLLGTINSIKK